MKQNDCIFCQIINKELESYVIYEDDKTLAFLDHFPNSDGHTLVIPKQHFGSYSETDNDYLAAVAITAKKIANLLKQKLPSIEGFNYISNEGELAKQVVFHYHLHVIPKYEKGIGFITHKNVIQDQLSSIKNIHQKLSKKADD